MRPIGIGLAAAVLLVAFAPATVLSASKKAAVDEKARAQGMAEAPAIVQQIGLGCQVTDARFVAKGQSSDKAVKGPTSYYEVDCATGSGYILSAPQGGTPDANTCIQMNTLETGAKSSLSCILPGNLDTLADVSVLTKAAGVQCSPKAVRWIGQTMSKTNAFMEVACQEGQGYVLVTSYTSDPAKPVTADNCLNFDEQGGNMSCKLTPKEARLAIVDGYVAQAKNGCTVKDRRYVGMAQDKSEIFETSCADGKGYMFKVKGGALETTWNCADASRIFGGCTLTDAREAMSEQAGLYTKLAKAAGSSCDVEKYQIFPAAPPKDAVELFCKDGSGGVGVFESGKTGHVYDCGHALVAGYKCSNTKLDTSYAALTADLRKFDVKTCTVSDMRLASKTTKGTILLEVACTDGLKGYMIEYNPEPVTAVGATGCAFMAGCKLKGNT